MTQSFPVDPETIYNTLIGDATFAGYLGTYTFTQNSSTVPAISIVSPGQNLPLIRKVAGVECVIHDMADVKRMDYVAGANDRTISWSMYLIAWEPSNGIDVTNAVQRAMEIFGGAESYETLAVATGLGALAQTKIVIPSNKPILI